VRPTECQIQEESEVLCRLPFMKDIILRCAEEAPVDRLKVQDGKVNYVPHSLPSKETWADKGGV